ncbi:MAG: F0F1 ATP synthase subunit B [Chthonomonas sp.]|nr:F0F1 ATP synthase subunit B [Chthonomonas sp.]
MANDIEKKPSSSTTAFKIIIGITLMLAGGYLNSQHTFKSIEEPLAAQGIPLTFGNTISVIGVFLILFPVLNSFFFAPLMTAINERNRELENTFSEAESLRKEMGDMKSAYEKRISDTEAEAREKIQAQLKEAQDLRTQLMADAATAKEHMIAQAQEEISREKDKIMNELRVEVVNLALGATEKLIGENVNNETNKRLVQEFIEKAEVPSK